MDNIKCLNCEANWSRGEFTEDCEMCGGGALERPCPMCDGRCGARWQRAILDSYDFGVAHWVGQCLLKGKMADQAPKG